MGFYLLDHPPASTQFYPTRNAAPTFAVGVHTSEGPTGPGSARGLAVFISRRTDPGSYACIIDADETIHMVPPEYTTFSVAASGYNSRTWHICLAGKSDELDPDDANTRAMIARAGAAIRDLWNTQRIPLTNAEWIGTDALNRSGLFCHGDVQPWDRSDAWTRHPDRGRLDAMLTDAIAPPTPPTPEDDDMASALGRDPQTGAIYHISGNIKVPLTNQKSVDLLVFLGAKWLGDLPPEWLTSLGTIKA